MEIDSFREEALALPEIERRRLVADLLASVEPSGVADEPAMHKAWLEEVARRGKRAVSGEEPGELWSRVEARLRHELAG